MLTPPLRTFIHEVITSTNHLQLLQFFHARPYGEYSARLIAELLCRDVWSVEQALSDLQAADLLSVTGGATGDVHYRLAPTDERHRQLLLLIAAFDDPLLRHDVQHEIRLRNRESAGSHHLMHATGRFGEQGLLLTEL